MSVPISKNLQDKKANKNVETSEEVAEEDVKPSQIQEEVPEPIQEEFPEPI